MVTTWTSGLGPTTGDALAIAHPLMVSGTVYYVDSQTGSDSNAGTSEDAPFATIGAAIAVAVARDIIVCLSGHTETLTDRIDMLVDGLTIIGGGTAAGIPTVKFKMNSGTREVFNMGAERCQVFCVRIEPNTQANTGPAILMGEVDCLIRGCYIEVGQYDDGPAISVTANRCRVEDTTVISVATSVATRPVRGLLSSGALTGLTVTGLTIDAGAYGFSSYGFDIGSAITDLRGEAVSLLRGANARIHASSTGYFNVATSTGGSSVSW